MSQKLYPMAMMKSDIKKDFKRYLEFNNEKDPASIKTRIIIATKSKGLWVIIIYRFGRWINAGFDKKYSKPLKYLLKTLYFLGRYFSVCFVKTEISLASEIGGGLFISNRGNIMLGADKMGENCTVQHNVTFGQDRSRKEPIFGDNVWIGADSVIYGGIKIGSNTVITEQTVLSKSIPGRMLVGGNPCKVIKKNIYDGPYPIIYPFVECQRGQI